MATLYYVDGEHSIPALLTKIKNYFVPNTRTVCGKALSSNVSLAYSDVTGASNIITRTVSLASGSWSSKAQTVTCNGVTTSNHVIVTPAPASYLNYHKWKVRCTAQAENKLTFTTDGTPSANLSVQVLILNGTTS